MNYKQIPKMKLFLGALVNRLNENADFFVGIDVVFKSGTKEFEMKITREENNYVSFFLGVKNEISENGIIDKII